LTTWVALLKGVNVGGHRTLRMADLVAFFEQLGFRGVKTLLASGNVVFEGTEEDPAALESMLEREASARLGLTTEFLVRSAEDLARIIEANPFPEVARDRPAQLLVAFGRSLVPQELSERIAAVYNGPERVAVAGRELYVDFVEGQGRSRLWPALADLGVSGAGTGRNWNTVIRIRQAMLDVPRRQS
jgi:uncharacterized protein (DUF1697 family)